MILETLIGGITTINLGVVGWLVKRQETIKQDFLNLRKMDLDQLNTNLSEIKTDVREIFKLLVEKK